MEAYAELSLLKTLTKKNKERFGEIEEIGSIDEEHGFEPCNHRWSKQFMYSINLWFGVHPMAQHMQVGRRCAANAERYAAFLDPGEAGDALRGQMSTSIFKLDRMESYKSVFQK